MKAADLLSDIWENPEFVVDKHVSPDGRLGMRITVHHRESGRVVTNKVRLIPGKAFLEFEDVASSLLVDWVNDFGLGTLTEMVEP